MEYPDAYSERLFERRRASAAERKAMTAPQIMTTGAVVSAQGAFSTAHGPMTKAAASVMTMPSSMFMS